MRSQDALEFLHSRGHDAHVDPFNGSRMIVCPDLSGMMTLVAFIRPDGTVDPKRVIEWIDNL